MPSLHNGTSMPRHEADIERETWAAFTHALRHPTALPSFCKSVYRDTKAYYAGRDLVDLEREELIVNLAWTRKVSVLSAGGAFLSLFFLLMQLILCRLEVHDGKKST